MQINGKKDLPPDQTRQLLEPGPVILVSSAFNGQRDIMAMGWYMMMEYNRVGCYIWDQNHSRSLICQSGECVINIPTVDMIDTIITIGNSHGTEIDKFEKCALTSVTGTEVSAPVIAECYANFECKLIDDTLIDKYSLFVFEVVKGYRKFRPEYPKTVHYRGDGKFMLAGDTIDYNGRFKALDKKRKIAA